MYEVTVGTDTNADCGNMRGHRMISGGRAVARMTLYMATMVATKRNPQTKIFYQQLCWLEKEKSCARCLHAKASYHHECHDKK